METTTTTATAAAIADAVVAWFDGARVAQKKHAAREWTVLAGVVLTVANGTEPPRVLAAATGTKCLGRRDLDAGGLVVNDCHAEVVARRALLRYLYHEARHWAARRLDEDGDASSIFTRDAASGKLRLKPGHALHLFISEPPCGDAAIYALQEAVVDALVERRTQRDEAAAVAGEDAATVERSELRLTGAKHKRLHTEEAAHGDGDGSVQDKRFAQAVGIARVKSGRSDLPLDKQTLSMSCSDKVAAWVARGVQGALLSRWFEPLRLASVVVAEDPTAHSRAAQQRAMERALRDRLPAIAVEVELRVVASTECHRRFSHQRDTEKSASPLSLNWTRSESHWVDADDDSNKKGWRAGFFASPDVEVLMAATGFREGAKKASKMDAAAKQRVASRLSKWSLFRAYDAVARVQRAQDDSDHDDDKLSATRTYAQEKAHVLGMEGEARLAQVKAALGDWVGVPVGFKSFQPHVE